MYWSFVKNVIRYYWTVTYYFLIIRHNRTVMLQMPFFFFNFISLIKL